MKARILEVAALMILAVLAGLSGYAIELLGPYATTKVLVVFFVLAVVVPFVGTAIWVLRQVEKRDRVNRSP